MTLSTTAKFQRETTIVKEFGELVSATAVIHATVPSNPFTGVNAFDQTGVPKEGDPFSSIYPELKVTDITMAVVARDNTAWRVRYDISYELERLIVGGEANTSAASDSVGYPLRGSASLLQKETIVDRDNARISVSEPLAQDSTAKALKQWPSVQVLVPTQTTMREAVYATDSPTSFVKQWVNYINGDNWTGAGSSPDENELLMWLCSSVSWSIFNANSSPKRYRFQFEFERATEETNPVTTGSGIRLRWFYQAGWRGADGNVPESASLENGAIVSVDHHPIRPFLRTFKTPQGTGAANITPSNPSESDGTGKMQRETVITKRFGEFVSAQTTLRVTSSQNPHTAVNVFDLPGVPKDGEVFSSKYPALVVTGKSFVVSGRLPTGAWRLVFDISYRQSRVGGSQVPNYPIQGNASLLQRKTFRDRAGDAIVVNNPHDTGDKLETSVDVLEPVQSTTREVVLTGDSPESIVRVWVGHVNQDSWSADPKGTWLCSSVDWELFNASSSPRQYIYRMEFQRAADVRVSKDDPASLVGWRYPVFYKVNGKVPSNATFENGAMTLVDWHKERPFGVVFPAT